MNQNQLRTLKRGDKVVVMLPFTGDSSTREVTKVFRGAVGKDPYIRVNGSPYKFSAENIVCKKV
jgi:hypothetical protein